LKRILGIKPLQVQATHGQNAIKINKCCAFEPSPPPIFPKGRYLFQSAQEIVSLFANNWRYRTERTNAPSLALPNARRLIGFGKNQSIEIQPADFVRIVQVCHHPSVAFPLP
tara:strand:- start:75 stop:410 length:336 start_codon:yes stop_codon:yes gene_type:complete